MTTPLRIIDTPPAGTSYYDPEPGDMWLCPNAGGSHDVEGRDPCWCIRLPGGGYVFHTNMESSNENEGLWDVSGVPPRITVKPSINVGPEIWHGWITDGALSPDADSSGRRK